MKNLPTKENEWILWTKNPLTEATEGKHFSTFLLLRLSSSILQSKFGNKWLSTSKALNAAWVSHLREICQISYFSVQKNFRCTNASCFTNVVGALELISHTLLPPMLLLLAKVLWKQGKTVLVDNESNMVNGWECINNLCANQWCLFYLLVK